MHPNWLDINVLRLVSRGRGLATLHVVPRGTNCSALHVQVYVHAVTWHACWAFLSLWSIVLVTWTTPKYNLPNRCTTNMSKVCLDLKLIPAFHLLFCLTCSQKFWNCFWLEINTNNATEANFTCHMDYAIKPTFSLAQEQKLLAPGDLVSSAAIFWDVTQCSPQRSGCSHPNHILFLLCLWFLCTLLNRPITYM